MGGSLDVRIYPDILTNREIADSWAMDVEQSRHDDGRSYSGQIGMLSSNIENWFNLSLSDESSAYEWISLNHEKGDPPVAVSFYRGVPTRDSKKKLDELELNMKVEASAYHKVLAKFYNQFRNRKSKFCTCTNCGSRINTHLLKGDMPSINDLYYPFYPDTYKGFYCPLCHKSFYTETAFKRIINAYKKLDKAHKAIEAYRIKAKDNNKFWMIGGICSS